MKRISILLITLMIIIISCKITIAQKNEIVIKDYLQKNLNDTSSYEPIEFKIGSSINNDKVPNLEQQFFNLENAYQRITEIVPYLINLTKSYLTQENKKQLIDIRDKCVNKDKLNLLNLTEIADLQEQLSKIIDKIIKSLVDKSISNQNILELESQIEGSENRIIVERRRLNEVLDFYGLNFPYNINYIKILYHKYRIKNNLGGLILKETIFVINEESHQVIKAIDL